jgi:hypothetical protein
MSMGDAFAEPMIIEILIHRARASGARHSLNQAHLQRSSQSKQVIPVLQNQIGVILVVKCHSTGCNRFRSIRLARVPHGGVKFKRGTRFQYHPDIVGEAESLVELKSWIDPRRKERRNS